MKGTYKAPFVFNLCKLINSADNFNLLPHKSSRGFMCARLIDCMTIFIPWIKGVYASALPSFDVQNVNQHRI